MTAGGGCRRGVREEGQESGTKGRDREAARENTRLQLASSALDAGEVTDCEYARQHMSCADRFCFVRSLF